MVSLAPPFLLYIVTGVVCLASTMAWWQPQSVISDDEMCTPEFCFGLDYKSIADMYYSGFFLTRWEMIQKLSQRRWNLKYPTRVRRDSPWQDTDYDYCCPTIMTYRNQSHLKNTNGDMRVIFHMYRLDPPRYQYIPHAECPDSLGACWEMGDNSGCQIQMITMDLLVYKRSQGQSMSPWHWPFEFDSFRIPGYCSCKSNI